MFVVALAPDSMIRAEVAPLVAARRVESVESGAHLREVLDRGGGSQRLLLGSSCGSYLLHHAVRACVEGRLADVRWLMDSKETQVEKLSLRLRPWLRGIHILPGGPDLSGWAPLPAPLVRSESVVAILESWGETPVRWEPAPSSFPSEIQIQTTSACSMGCAFCPKSTRSMDEGEMDDALFERLMQSCSDGRPDVLELYFHGEPLEDGKLVERSILAKHACPDALVSIVTHWRRLLRSSVDDLARSGLDVVFVSYNPWPRLEETEIRRDLEALERASNLLAGDGKRLVVTTLRNLIPMGFRSRFRRLCNDLGLSLESFRATSRAGSVQLQPFLPGNSKASEQRRAGVCERPFTRAYVRWNGLLAQCCEDWSYERELGDASTEDLGALWLSRDYQELRSELLERRYTGACAHCDYAGGGGDRHQEGEGI